MFVTGVQTCALPIFANFASRYVCRGGKQAFTHFTSRCSGRYMQLHITRAGGTVVLRHAGLIPVEYPLPMRGAFASPDSLLNRIYDVSRRTLHLCIHEHYEDTPWREQALYANDARSQALIGYYAFGEYDVPRVSLDLLGRGFGADGMQELCAPMRFDFTIPSFTLVWYLALRDHLLFSGDLENARRVLPAAVETLSLWRKRLVGDLLPTPTGKRYWHFYDWASGMDGTDCYPARGQGLSGQRFDAPLNFFFVLALRAVAEMLEICGDNSGAEEFRAAATAAARAAQTLFLDRERGLFVTYAGERAIPGHYAELTQSLALLAGIPEREDAERLRRSLACREVPLVPAALSQSLYKFDALLSGGDAFAGGVFERIREDWGKMLCQGATAFWETLGGQRDFSGYGSLCHGWSAVPAYIFQRHLLGVTPIAPGFRRFRVAPLLSVTDSASGTVPVPDGNIEVAWRREGGYYAGSISFPSGCEPELPDDGRVKWRLRRV